MLDFIGFTFEDFDKGCVVIVNQLPKSGSEDKLLELLCHFGYISFVGKGVGETRGELNFLNLITTGVPYVATFQFTIFQFFSHFRFSRVQAFTGSSMCRR